MRRSDLEGEEMGQLKHRLSEALEDPDSAGDDDRTLLNDQAMLGRPKPSNSFLGTSRRLALYAIVLVLLGVLGVGARTRARCPT